MRYLIFLLIASLLTAGNIRRDSAREVVVDTGTNLMWQDSQDVITLLKSQADAVSYCENLKFAGYSNWRIPSIKDFETIVDKKNEVNYIHKSFRYNVPDGYWADKVLWRTLWFYAYYMHFVSGNPYYDNKKKLKYVRCVRDIR